MNTEALVSHLPLVLAAPHLAGVLHGAPQHVQGLASLLVSVLWARRVLGEVDSRVVVTVRVVVAQRVQLLLVEAQVLGVLPCGSLTDEAAVELLTDDSRNLLQLSVLLLPVSSDGLPNLLHSLGLLLLQRGLQQEVDNPQVDAILLEAHHSCRSPPPVPVTGWEGTLVPEPRAEHFQRVPSLVSVVRPRVDDVLVMVSVVETTRVVVHQLIQSILQV